MYQTFENIFLTRKQAEKLSFVSGSYLRRKWQHWSAARNKCDTIDLCELPTSSKRRGVENMMVTGAVTRRAPNASRTIMVAVIR